MIYYDDYEKRTELDVVLKIISYKAHAMIYASHKIEENFEINGIKIDVYIFHIKIMK